MDKSLVIEKIARHFGVQDSGQKLFFEILLRKCSEALNAGESLQIGEIGKLEFRKAQNEENEDTMAVTIGEDEFVFDIPEEDKEIQSIDSYFSISIGKPVIPLKDNDDSEFFIPHSGNEMKRMFELKVDRFIEDARKSETEAEESPLDFSDNVPDINFSFKNWKSSSDIDSDLSEEKIVDQEESDLSEIKTEENKFVEEPDIEDKAEEQVVNDSVQEISEEIFETAETQLEEITPEIEEVPQSVEEITGKIEDKEINKAENIEEELKPSLDQIESSYVSIDEDEKNIENNNEQPIEEVYSEVDSQSLSEDENVNDDKQAISEAVKYAEEKEERLENYRKRSNGGFIFAFIIIVIIGVVIYFSYYSTNTKNKTTAQQPETPQEFAATVERSYEIPVTYPYEKGMLGVAYKAIDDEILNESGNEEVVSKVNADETVSSNNNIPENVEIRNSLPASRVKGYIYKYENMYAVQISSWKSKSIATSEAKKFLNAGYNAFIEQTELGNKGTYYRVRIGGFSSLEEAEDFLKK